MPITGSVFACRAPAPGRATSFSARPAAPARGLAPSPVGPVQPHRLLSVQSAPSRAGHSLPLLHACVCSISVTADELRRQPRIVRLGEIRRERGAHSGA